MNTKKMQKTMSKRIITMCRAEGISYYQLAYKSTVPMTTLMNILNEKTKNPGLATIIKLCDALGVSLAEFFDTEDFAALLKETV